MISGPLAQSFTTGSTGLDLADLDLDLAVTGSSRGDTDTLLVTLMADDNNAPGSTVMTLGTIPDSALSTALGLYDLEIATPVPLSADTRYWVEISGATSLAEWSYTSDTSGPGVGSEYTYNNYNDFGSPGVADVIAGGGLYQMCVASTAGECAPSGSTTTSPGSPGSSDGPSAPTPPGVLSPPPPPPPVQPPVTPTFSDSVPEPSTVSLFALALAGLAGLRFRGGRSGRRPAG